MLEQEAGTIIATLRDRTIGDRTAILLGEVLAADVPRGIKTYLQAEAIRGLETDLFASPQFSRVDRQSHAVRRQARAFIASMAASYTFPREEYLSLLTSAIHFLGNYLCRPQWTIEHFVFDSGDPVAVQEVMRKLDSTVDYAYFRTLIQKLLERRGTREISSDEFRTLLVRIDDQIVRQHNARELALLAKPIFDFLLLRDTPPDVSIPLKPILVFFEDKKMKILRDYIESICRIRHREEITLDELTTFVEDLYLGQADAASAVPQPKEVTPSTEGKTERAAAVVVAPDAPTLAPPSVAPNETPSSTPPPVEQFASPPTIEIDIPSAFGYVTEEPDGREDEPPADVAPPRPPSAPSPPRAPEPYERLFATPEPPAGLVDLREMIQGHVRSRFVKRLFGRSEERYEDAVTALNTCLTWKDASLLLHRLYMESGLDPFDTDVVEFTDAIQRRYLEAGKDG